MVLFIKTYGTHHEGVIYRMHNLVDLTRPSSVKNAEHGYALI